MRERRRNSTPPEIESTANTQPTETQSEDSETEKDDQTVDDTPKKEVLALTWNLGYVASSTHGTKPNQIVSGSEGGYYSYTDVFTVEKAGTTITFIDDNSNSNADLKFASSSVYVVSSWKMQGDEWTIDLESANLLILRA